MIFKKKTTPILLAIFTYTSIATAQVRVEFPAFTFLNILPDAETMMVSGTLAGIPSTTSTAFFYNPAQLGNFGTTNSFLYQFFPSKNSLENGVSLNSSSIAAGIEIDNTPLSIGVGYLNHSVDHKDYFYYWFNKPEDPFFARDYSNTFSLGIQLNMPVKLALGFSLKKINSELYTTKTSATSLDIGTLASYDLKFRKIKMGVSMGYTIRNEGRNVEGTEVSQYNTTFRFTTIPVVVERSFALPRNQVLGYGISVSFEDDFINRQRTIFQISWSAQTEELRPKYSNSEFLLKNANIRSIFSNMLTGKSAENLTNSQAFSIELIEIVNFSVGQFNAGIANNVKTYGFSIFANPFFSLFFNGKNNPIGNFFLHHIDFSYSIARYSTESNLILGDSTISSFSISIINL